MPKLSDAELVDLFLRVLRDREVYGHQNVSAATGVPRNTYYRMERGETQRLNYTTRGKMESYLESVDALTPEGDIIGIDPVDELVRALSHPAVRGFLGTLSANDRVNAALAYAEARKFTEQQKARIFRWASHELSPQADESTSASHHGTINER